MLKRLLLNRITLTIVGIILLAIVVWFAGPLFAFADWHPLGPVANRLWFMLGVLAILFLPALFKWVLRTIFSKKLIAEIKAQAEKDVAKDEAPHPDVVAMNQRFDKAIKQLKKQPKQKSLYQLPWYIIIGPPGTGKTTAIRNSDLTFPLDNYDQEDIQGIGGTRHCHWWFTKETVLIDTAGRYFTQDSDEEVDQSEWLSFLSLLRQYRRRRPINGAIITLSVDQLLNTSREERLRHAQTIKARINELHEKLQIRVPVYFMVTKVDSIRGFMPFFENLRHDERAQVWGFTLPETITSQLLYKELNDHFEQLLNRLNSHVIERIQSETDLNQRHEILDFPHHLASYQGAICSLLRDLFTDLDCEKHALLRGVYLTSGTQEATALDRAVSAMSSPIQMTSNQSEMANEGKGFFINNVFTKVIFAESGLVGQNTSLENKLNWFKRFGFAALGVCFLLIGFTLVGKYLQNKSFVQDSTVSLNKLEPSLESHIQHGQGFQNASLFERVKLLDDIQALPALKDQEVGESFWHRFSNLGLSQYDNLTPHNVNLYNTANKNIIMPVVVDHLGAILKNNTLTKKYHYQALKAYLMLKSEEHYNAEFIAALLGITWFPSVELSETKKASFVQHVHYLLDNYNPSQRRFLLDETLIDNTRSRLLLEPLDESIYQSLISLASNSEEINQIQGFTLYNALGGIDSERLFIRKSGASLRSGISPLFTKKGYYIFSSSLPFRVKEIFSERQWVLLDEESSIQSASDIKTLTSNIKDRYESEYILHYSTLLNDLTIAPFSSARSSADSLRKLSHPQTSPLITLSRQLGKQTTFESLSDLNVNVQKPSVVNRVNNQTERVLNGLGINESQEEIKQTLHPITEAFSPLTKLTNPTGDTPSGVSSVLELIANLQRYMQLVAASEIDGAAIGPQVSEQGQAAALAMKLEAQNLPAPFKSVLNSAAQQVSDKTQNGIKDFLNAAWKAQTFPYCSRAISNRYPIVASSKQVTLEDFGRYFGYGGIVDGFFNERLQNFVDISTKPWSNKQSGPNAISLSGSGIAQLENADKIKRAFFAYGSDKPSVRFSLTPKSMAKNIAESKLTINGQSIDYKHGPQNPQTFEWPGDSSNQESVLSLRLFDGRTLYLNEVGDWGFFELIQKGRLTRQSNGESFTLTFNVEGFQASYNLRALSAFHPFGLSALTQYRCKQGL